MPDITMCTGEGCPMAEQCYRRRARPSHWQSYFASPPVRDGKCEHFWPVAAHTERRGDPGGGE